jgi:chondroitin AC lyase
MRLKILFLLVLGFLFAAGTAQGDFEVVKQRVVSEILQSRVNDDRVSEIVRTIAPGGSWPGIDYADVSNTGFAHTIHLRNMVIISLAYHKESSEFYRSEEVGQVINRELNFWCEHDFICENWWHNQIGTPQSLVTVLLIMDGGIDPDLVERTLPIIGRANLEVSGARQGGDRIKVGGIAAKRGLVVGDETGFGEIMKVFKLWIDHGVQPQGRIGGLVNEPMIAEDVTYQYIVVPTA